MSEGKKPQCLFTDSATSITAKIDQLAKDNFESTQGTPLTSRTANGFVNLQSFSVVATPFGLKNWQVHLYVKSFTFTRIFEDNQPLDVQPVHERPEVGRFLNTLKKLRSGVVDEEDNEADDELDDQELVEVGHHGWTQSQSQKRERFKPENARTHPVQEVVPRAMQRNRVQQGRAHLSTPSRGINLQSPVPASSPSTSQQQVSGQKLLGLLSKVKAAPSTQVQKAAVLALLSRGNPGVSPPEEKGTLITASTGLEQRFLSLAAEAHPEPANMHAYGNDPGQEPLCAAEAPTPAPRLEITSSAIEIDAHESVIPEQETQTSIDMMTQAPLLRVTEAESIYLDERNEQHEAPAIAGADQDDLTMFDAPDKDLPETPTSAQPDQDLDVRMYDAGDLSLDGHNNGQSKEFDTLPQMEMLPADQPLDRLPNLRYTEYARRRLPRDQNKLLDRKDAWLPSLPGNRFPHPNVPVAILNGLEDAVERIGLIGDDLYDGQHFATAMDEASSDVDSSAPLPGWPSSSPVQQPRIQKSALPPDSSIENGLKVPDEASITSSPPVSDFDDDFTDGSDNASQGDNNDETPKQMLVHEAPEEVIISTEVTSVAQSSFGTILPLSIASPKSTTPKVLAQQPISNDFISASFSSSPSIQSNKRSLSPPQTFQHTADAMFGTPPRHDASQLPRIEVQETPNKATISSLRPEILSDVPLSSKKRMHSPAKPEPKKKACKSNHVDWGSSDVQPPVNPKDAYRRKRREYFNKEHTSVTAAPSTTKVSSSAIANPAVVTAPPASDLQVLSPDIAMKSSGNTPGLAEHNANSGPVAYQQMPSRVKRNCSPDAILEPQEKSKPESREPVPIRQAQRTSTLEVAKNRELRVGSMDSPENHSIRAVALPSAAVQPDRTAAASTPHNNTTFDPKSTAAPTLRANSLQRISASLVNVVVGMNPIEEAASTETMKDTKTGLHQLFGRFRDRYREYDGTMKHFENTCRMLVLSDPAVYPAQWDLFIVNRNHEYKRYVDRAEEDGEPHLTYEQYWRKHLQNTLGTPKEFPLLHARLVKPLLGMPSMGQPTPLAKGIQSSSEINTSYPPVSASPAMTSAMTAQIPPQAPSSVSSLTPGALITPGLVSARMQELAAMKEPDRALDWLKEYYEPHPSSSLTQKEIWRAYKAAFQKYEKHLDPKVFVSLVIGASEAYALEKVQNEDGSATFRIRGIRLKINPPFASAGTSGKVRNASHPPITESRTVQEQPLPPRAPRAMRGPGYKPDYRASGPSRRPGFDPQTWISSANTADVRRSDINPSVDRSQTKPSEAAQRTAGSRRSLPWTTTPRQTPAGQLGGNRVPSSSESYLPRRPQLSPQLHDDRRRTFPPRQRDPQGKPSPSDSRKV